MPSSSSSSTNDHLPPPTTVAKRKAGRKKFQETRHPIYKGVRQRNGKWVSELRRPNKKSSFWVGTFCSPKTAAVAYDVVALAIKGESASLNFPEFAHSFPRVVSSSSSSSSINEIRAMAVKTAETFTASDILTPLSPSSPSLSSSLLCSLMSEEKVVPNFFWDEEEVFNMPAIIAGMAEGLIITPPGMKREFDWEDSENTIELSLWSHE